MIRRNKYILVFSILYWLVAITGIVLFSVSFQKVPIGYYGLKANYFNPNVEPQYYSPGLYDAGVGFYFILFPSAKQYIVDNKVSIINKNLQKLIVTYTLCYRIDPTKILTLYQTSGFDYSKTLIAAANVPSQLIKNMISGAFVTVPQYQSRVTIQSTLISNLLGSGNKISSSLNNAILVQGFFINQIQFPQQIQLQYQQTVDISSMYEQSYETTKVQYQKTLLQIENVKTTIDLLKRQYKFGAQQAYKQQFLNVLTTDLTNQQKNQTQLSAKYLIKRIWQYYNSTKMIFI